MLIDHAARRLLWDACHNVRDIGGYDTADGRHIRWRAVVRADDLCNLSEEGSERLIDYGIRTVIDLRGPWESPHDSSPFARSSRYAETVTYLNLPVIDVTEFTGSPVERARTIEESYRVILDVYQSEIAAVMTAIARARAGGILIHCHAGKYRTGLITGLLLSLAGVPVETLAEDYALSDTYLQPLYDRWLEHVPENADPEMVERLRQYELCLPDTMLATLSYIDERHGGAESYLIDAAVDPRDVERIRQRIVE